MPKGRKPTPEELARRLRENLRRRKVQQRARRQDGFDASLAKEKGRMDGRSPSAAGSEQRVAVSEDRPGTGDDG